LFPDTKLTVWRNGLTAGWLGECDVRLIDSVSTPLY